MIPVRTLVQMDSTELTAWTFVAVAKTRRRAAWKLVNASAANWDINRPFATNPALTDSGVISVWKNVTAQPEIAITKRASATQVSVEMSMAVPMGGVGATVKSNAKKENADGIVPNRAVPAPGSNRATMSTAPVLEDVRKDGRAIDARLGGSVCPMLTPAKIIRHVDRFREQLINTCGQ